MSWQPIETAPKDGTMILLSSGCQVFPGWWDESYVGYPWIIMVMAARCQSEGGQLAALASASDGSFLTRWAPLPAPPDNQ